MKQVEFESLMALATRWEATVELREGTKQGKEYETDPIVGAALELRDELAKLTLRDKPMLELLIYCPRCLKQHIDEGDFATKPHKTHACQFCGLGFRASKEPSVGVQFFSGWKNTGVRIEPTGGPPYISYPSLRPGEQLVAHIGDEVTVRTGAVETPTFRMHEPVLHMPSGRLGKIAGAQSVAHPGAVKVLFDGLPEQAVPELVDPHNLARR